jgi:hypothetical protein
MNRKITLKSFSLLCALACSSFLNAQQIYTNGGFSTGATSASGVAAPAGFTWSELQSDTGNTTESNGSFGFSAFYNTAGTTNFALADDFVVPTGEIWNVTSFDFFVYQTNYAGVVPPIDELRVQVFNGDPSAGGVVVAGSLTTDVYDPTGSDDSLIFRTGNSQTPAPGTTPGTNRKVWKVRGTLSTALPAGTYWVVYQAHASNDASIFLPPLTVVGSRGLPSWNAKQLTVTTTTWANAIDTGNPAAAPDVQQDFPFIVNGTVLGNNENAFEASITFSPNPVKNTISLQIPTDVVLSSIEIYDLNGKVVKNVTNATGLEVNVSDLSSGNYIMKLTSDKGIASKKFIKE